MVFALQIWPIFFQQVIAALVLFQIMMVAILGIKQSFSGILASPFLAILVITVLFSKIEKH